MGKRTLSNAHVTDAKGLAGRVLALEKEQARLHKHVGQMQLQVIKLQAWVLTKQREDLDYAARVAKTSMHATVPTAACDKWLNISLQAFMQAEELAQPWYRRLYREALRMLRHAQGRRLAPVVSKPRIGGAP